MAPPGRFDFGVRCEMRCGTRERERKAALACLCLLACRSRCDASRPTSVSCSKRERKSGERDQQPITPLISVDSDSDSLEDRPTTRHISCFSNANPPHPLHAARSDLGPGTRCSRDSTLTAHSSTAATSEQVCSSVPQVDLVGVAGVAQQT